MKFKQIFVWNHVLTSHMSETYNEMAIISKKKLTVFSTHFETTERKKQGWNFEKTNSLKNILIPTISLPYFVARLICSNRDAIHIFSSPTANIKLITTVFIAFLMRKNFFIISEPYCPLSYAYFNEARPWTLGLKAKIRPVLYQLIYRTIKSQISGYFAISKLSISQANAVGIPFEKIYPFGYFVKQKYLNLGPSPLPESPTRCSKIFRVVFVGNRIPIKGIDFAISCIKEFAVTKDGITLTIFGSGTFCENEIDKKVIFDGGMIPFGESPQIMSSFDLIVVPSFYDGWAVVVNEAIFANIPILVSDAVGASVLVDKFNLGAVFKSNSRSDFLSKLELQYQLRLKYDQEFNRRVNDASKRISPNIAAQYLVDNIFVDNRKEQLNLSPWYL